MSEWLKESEIEAKTCIYAKNKGCLHFKIRALRGWPDRLIMYNGHTMFIEFKKPGEKPEPLQRYIHGIIKQSGFDVAVVDSIQQGRDVIDRFVVSSSDF